MVQLSDYEQRGDLEVAFAVDKRHERDQRQAEKLREAMRCEIAPLTWEQYVAGEPCPGCGLSYQDAERWEFKGTMHFTGEERARYDAERNRFASAHADCHAHRHSVAGSLTAHCGKCCPAPPLSPTQIADIRRILSRPTRPGELMRWRLRLYCGHVVEKRAHYSHTTLHAAFTGRARCPQCGLDPATIVDGRAIGLQAEPAPRTPGNMAVPARPTKSRLESRVRELEAEITQLRRDVAGRTEPRTSALGEQEPTGL